VNVGSHGENDFVFASGEPVSDTGDSELVFESGVGLGGGQGWTITISDSNGKESGSLQVIERDQTVEEFYGYETGSPVSSAGGEAGTEFAQDGYLTWMVYRNTGTGTLSLVVVYDEHGGSYEGSGSSPFDVSYDGLASSTSIAVRDDDSDSYSLNPPSGYTAHTWGGNNTDGVVFKDAFDGELTISLGSSLGDFYSARGIGENKDTVSRAVIENETTITISI